MRYDIPIDFCPKCKNKRITVVMGKSIETEYSLSGKCIRKQKHGDMTYMLLKCNKCGWVSHAWSEAGYEDEKEFIELQNIYIKSQEGKQ